MTYLSMDPQKQDDDERTEEELVADKVRDEDAMIAFHERYEDKK